MKTSIFSGLFILCSFIAPLASAHADSLQQLIEDAQSRCPRLNCPQERVWVVSMPDSEQRQLDDSTRTAMKQDVVDMVAQMWPEAVLQNGFKNLNRLRVDKLEKLVIDGEMAGYRMSYSDKAWDLNTCSYDDQTPGSLNNCATGRIFESAFLSLDLQTVFPDDQARATYQPDTTGN